MKRILILTLLLTLAFPFVFANGGEEEPAAKAGPVEFEFWTTETQSDRLATITGTRRYVHGHQPGRIHKRHPR